MDEEDGEVRRRLEELRQQAETQAKINLGRPGSPQHQIDDNRLRDEVAMRVLARVASIGSRYSVPEDVRVSFQYADEFLKQRSER